MGDVHGFYARLGLQLPRRESEWVPVRCFLPEHQDRHASAQINTANGVFHCMRCNTARSPFAVATGLGFGRADAAKLTKDHGLWKGQEGSVERPAGTRSAAPLSPAESIPTGQPASEQINWAELAVAAPPQDLAKLVRRREWTYVDEHAKPLFRSVRQDFDDGSKRFWQETMQNGKWAPGLGKARRVLYRLPEVLEHAKGGRLILVVEGEKAVDALDRIGVFATTSPAGAGKWRDEYAEPLRGATVCPVADCDLPGRRHMADAANSLLRACVTVLGPLDLDESRSDGFDITDRLMGVAARNPDASKAEVRETLRAYVLGLVTKREQATFDVVAAWQEQFEYRANPESRQLLPCERCGRERVHVVRSGFAYCPCGLLNREWRAEAA